MSYLNLNPFDLFILASKLTPFIIVCIFSIYAILNGSINGLFYLAGLLFASVISTSIGLLPSLKYNREQTPGSTCNSLSIGSQGRFSNIPLGLVTISYTFWFLMYIIIKYDLVISNLATIIIFPILILLEIYYNINCAKLISIIIAILIGGAIGTGLVAILDKFEVFDSKYFNPIGEKW